CSSSQNQLQKRSGVAEVRDHDVGTDAREPLAFPLVHLTRAVVGLVAGHADGPAAGLSGVLDLDVAVAEGEKLLAANAVLADDPLDDHLLGERLVIILVAVDPAPEVRVQAQQLGLLLDKDLVGSAGQVDRQSALFEVLQQATSPMNEQVVGLDRSLPQPANAVLDPEVEPAEVFVLVPERFP